MCTGGAMSLGNPNAEASNAQSRSWSLAEAVLKKVWPHLPWAFCTITIFVLAE